MGWSSGSRLFSEMIEVLVEKVEDDSVRKDLYTDLIDVFENHDCDNLHECLGEDDAFDEAWYELYPAEEEEIEEDWDNPDPFED